MRLLWRIVFLHNNRIPSTFTLHIKNFFFISNRFCENFHYWSWNIFSYWVCLSYYLFQHVIFLSLFFFFSFTLLKIKIISWIIIFIFSNVLIWFIFIINLFLNIFPSNFCNHILCSAHSVRLTNSISVINKVIHLCNYDFYEIGLFPLINIYNVVDFYW